MSNLDISRAERLDNYVVSRLPEFSRSYAAKLIGDGKVSVNGVATLKAGYKLRANDSIIIDYDPSLQSIVPSIELPIIYEDNDCVVISKPNGLLTHSKGAFNPEATVGTWLGARLKSLNGERAGIVHRLDRATSGVMICAKNPSSLKWLQKQFSQRRVKKTYVAIISGHLEQPQAIINMAIERNPKNPQTFRVGKDGKSAVTAYHVLQINGSYSLLELKPETGRTHQLRVHMKQLGHPILGDTLYGGQPAERLYLHAKKLEITLPSKERRVFEVDVPPSFEQEMNRHA